jgi:predicted  nucleic acid-binding Zn-ribbon protein
VSKHNVPKEILERNVQELTEQLYGCYQRITFLNARVEELEKENSALKSTFAEEIEALKADGLWDNDERT